MNLSIDEPLKIRLSKLAFDSGTSASALVESWIENAAKKAGVAG